jgi:hypothetical protein
MEDWNIWERWQLAFLGGKATIGSHPALPEDAERHAEPKMPLNKSLVIDPSKVLIRIGEFETSGESNLPKGGVRPLQVKWSGPGESPGFGS